jgi:hypothetical protein
LSTGGSTGGAILPVGREQVTGEMTDFAASARVMRVRGDDGGERQISLAPAAVIHRADGSAGTPADLQPGLRLRAAGQKGTGEALVADDVVLLTRR